MDSEIFFIFLSLILTFLSAQLRVFYFIFDILLCQNYDRTLAWSAEVVGDKTGLLGRTSMPWALSVLGVVARVATHKHEFQYL